MRKSIAATALAAASIAGIGAGITLGFPGISNAETATTTAGTGATTTDPTTSTATARPDRSTIVNDALAKLVTAGTITQAQSDAVAKALTDALPAKGMDGRGGRVGGASLTVAAKAIGISEADLRTALQGGQTIAQVAATHNVTADAVAAAIKADLQTRLAAQVTAGTITQAQADERLAGADARITAELNEVGHAGGPGGPGGRGGHQRGTGTAPAVAPAAAASSASA